MTARSVLFVQANDPAYYPPVINAAILILAAASSTVSVLSSSYTLGSVRTSTSFFSSTMALRADSIAKCLPKAAECGVMLALENHWGLTRKRAMLGWEAGQTSAVQDV